MISKKIFETRRGAPSPLIFHLNACIAAAIGDATPSRLKANISELGAARNKMAAVLGGLEKWQQHPHHRNIADPPTIWQAGGSKLLDYGQTAPSLSHDAAPVLVLPSLVNKSYILDISSRRSMLRNLAKRGLRPILLDWGTPEGDELNFDINDYITQRALVALDIIQKMTGKSVGVIGYCMGGTLAAAICQTSHNINALCTIGAPWNFSDATGNRLLMQKAGSQNDGKDLKFLLVEMARVFGKIPFEFMQYLFAAIDPAQFASKFLRFEKIDQGSKMCKNFVEIEDWLADPVPLAGPAAIDLLLHWHVRNQIMSGGWLLKNEVIDATKILTPSLFICGIRDSIAPLNSTLALPNQVRNSTLLQPNSGHVGMIVGSNAERDVISPMASFLLGHAD